MKKFPTISIAVLAKEAPPNQFLIMNFVYNDEPFEEVVALLKNLIIFPPQLFALHLLLDF